jgi:ABC-2 type transport system ATP-binding protein
VHDATVKAQIGFLPEQPYFYDYLTALELLDYYAQLSGVPSTERKRRVPQMLERVGLSDAANMQLRKFSKGMLQRCGIAQAIIHDPKIVFLDEPMSGLDPVGRREVRDLIASLHDEGKTIFFSTHILSDAEALCDRVAVLHKGELRGVCVVADLVAQQRGKVEVTWHASQDLPSLKNRAERYHTAGESTRAVFPEEEAYQVIDALKAANARLISVTPLQGSLEDYFLRHIDRASEELEVRA